MSIPTIADIKARLDELAKVRDDQSTKYGDARSAYYRREEEVYVDLTTGKTVFFVSLRPETDFEFAVCDTEDFVNYNEEKKPVPCINMFATTDFEFKLVSPNAINVQQAHLDAANKFLEFLKSHPSNRTNLSKHVILNKQFKHVAFSPEQVFKSIDDLPTRLIAYIKCVKPNIHIVKGKRFEDLKLVNGLHEVYDGVLVTKYDGVELEAVKQLKTHKYMTKSKFTY